MADSSSTEGLLPSDRPAMRQMPSQRAQDSASSDPSDSPRRRRSSISTRHILRRFQAHSPREELPAERKEWNEKREDADDALRRLAQAAEPSTLMEALRSKMGMRQSTDRRDALREDWKTAVDFYARPRSQIPVYITDFRANEAEHFTCELGHIEAHFDKKPAEVEFRWIHVPIGRGILQSTIEEIFNYTGSQTMGKPFCNTGDGSWAFPTMPMLAFWPQRLLQTMVAACKELDKLETREDSDFAVNTLEHFSELQKRDLTWRAGVLNRELNHWDMVESEFPSTLGQLYLGQGTPVDTRATLASRSGEQALSRTEQFKGAVLMTNLLRAFHRTDGYILTFSSLSGVHYMGENFRDCLNSSPEAVVRDEEASVFGHAFEAFSDTGTSNWGRRTAEWFITYLFTEAAVTPHNIRHGSNTASYLQGFVSIARELDQQHRHMVKGDRSKLVSQYVECIRDLKALQALTLNKETVIARMRDDCEIFEREWDAEGVERNTAPDVESTFDRLEWAKGLLSQQAGNLDRLVTYFENSMNIVFQQQSIELNELAIVADSQNGAILIFTAVTIVFLPLSFLTSYFGMNLEGIANSTRGERFFWKLSAAFATVLIVSVFVTAYKRSIARQARHLRTTARDSLFGFYGLSEAGGPLLKGDPEKGQSVSSGRKGSATSGRKGSVAKE